jgi:hypothetical protein
VAHRKVVKFIVKRWPPIGYVDVYMRLLSAVTRIRTHRFFLASGIQIRDYFLRIQILPCDCHPDQTCNVSSSVYIQRKPSNYCLELWYRYWFFKFWLLPAVLSWLSCPGCPVPYVLSRLSCPRCPVPAVLN